MDLLAVISIFLTVATTQGWFFVEANEELDDQPHESGVTHHPSALKEHGLAEKHDEDADIHRVANIAI
jgi:hypothetical protein